MQTSRYPDAVALLSPLPPLGVWIDGDSGAPPTRLASTNSSDLLAIPDAGALKHRRCFAAGDNISLDRSWRTVEIEARLDLIATAPRRATVRTNRHYLHLFTKRILGKDLGKGCSTTTRCQHVASDCFDWRPVRDSNSCYRRERAVSWASRRTGRSAPRHEQSGRRWGSGPARTGQALSSLPHYTDASDRLQTHPQPDLARASG
jgi:hypothetical protein